MSSNARTWSRESQARSPIRTSLRPIYMASRRNQGCPAAAETTEQAERQKAVDAVMPDAAEAERSAWAPKVRRDRLH